MREFNPAWLTISEFSSVIPMDMYHKEQQENPAPTCPIQNLHVLARAVYQMTSVEAQTILRISVDDYYKLYVNGRFIAQGPAPSYVEDYYYNTIDLTPYLHEGDNVIAVHLYYQGLLNRVWNSGDGRFAFAADITDMSTNVSSDLNWKYKISEAFSGKTVGYDTQYLEDFDSRKWDLNWNLAGLSDDSKWNAMVPAAWADYSLSPLSTKMLDTYEMLPAHIWERDNSLLIDFGSEITGSLLLTARGKSGQQVVIHSGEECNADGSVRSKMRCNCDYEETWTLDNGICCLEQYDYKAFRYVQLFYEEGAEIQEVLVQVRHYPLKEKLCTLKSSISELESIFDLCKNTVKYGTQEGYLDCPSREKGQYLGDSVVTAHAQILLSGSDEMLRKCIRQFAGTAQICPGLMGVAPGSFMQEIADFSLLWSQLLITEYNYSGDKEFLREYYPTALNIIRHFSQYSRKDGLLEQVADKWNLVDWPENLRDDYDFELSRPIVAAGCHNVVNALYIGAVQTLTAIEKILGIPVSYDWEKLKKAYIHTFFRPEKGLFVDSETSEHSSLHSHIYSLYFGLAPESAKEKIADFMLTKGFCCGVFASYFYLKALARMGRYDDVYHMIINETEHGWMNMLREGATTCFEAWGKEQKWNTSLCHPWACAPIPLIIEDIAGFVPAPSEKNGFLFMPHIPEEIEYFRVQIPFRGNLYIITKEHNKISNEVYKNAE